MEENRGSGSYKSVGKMKEEEESSFSVCKASKAVEYDEIWRLASSFTDAAINA